MEFATLAAYKPAKTGELAKSTASSCLNMNKLIGQEVEHMQIFHSFQPPQVPWIYILHFSLYIPWIIFQNPQSCGQMVRSSQQCLLFITLPTNNVTSCSLLVWAENEQLGSMRSSTRRTDDQSSNCRSLAHNMHVEKKSINFVPCVGAPASKYKRTVHFMLFSF